jgi:unsaturated chondroitin disaccharide hydrolase
MLWIGYLLTHEAQWTADAAAWAKKLEGRSGDTSTHDMGFLFEPSFVRGWSITRDTYYRDVALQAAESLLTRYRPLGQFIQAWDHGPGGRAIIDTMMNLSLLFWAGRIDIATCVADTTLREHLRSDGSTYHVVDFDPNTGRVVHRGTHQGWSEASCWSRGQAWAIYGFSRTYIWTSEPRFLAAAQTAADYFLRRLPDDQIPPWDFDAPAGGPRDTSAAAVAASGLLDLERIVGGYGKAAQGILQALCGNLANSKSDGILLHGAGNVPQSDAVDESLIYGDYYFVEALCKTLRPDLWSVLMNPVPP